MCDLNSGYTPSDFFAKLVIKPQNYETPENMRFSQRSTFTYGLKFASNPKAQSAKKIQFKALSPRKIPTTDYAYPQTPKKSLQKHTLKVHRGQKSFNHSLNPQGISPKQGSQSFSTSFKQQILFKSLPQNRPATIQQDKEKQRKNQIQTTFLTEQELAIKKTKMILQTLLKNQMSYSQVEKVVNSLEEGLKSPQKFDKIIEGRAQQNFNLSKPENHAKKLTKMRSSSLKIDVKQNPRLSKRVKSESKAKKKVVSKKQKKVLSNKIRGEILKNIKKMKQLVLVNQKSLRLSKKVSLK